MLYFPRKKQPYFNFFWNKASRKGYLAMKTLELLNSHDLDALKQIRSGCSVLVQFTHSLTFTVSTFYFPL